MIDLHPATWQERRANFEAYWTYCVGHDGALLHSDRDLEKKRDALAAFQADRVRSRRPLADPAGFYRNCVIMNDDLRTLDRKTVMLTFLYKFARHEYVGISSAWDRTRPISESTSIIAKIGLYQLCEEFSHIPLTVRTPCGRMSLDQKGHGNSRTAMKRL